MQLNKQSTVVITGGIHRTGVEKLLQHCSVRLWDGEGTIPRAQLMEWLQEADALIPSFGVKVDQELLAAAPKLRVIAQSAVGYDNIDIAACAAAGVPFGNTPGVLVDATADLTLALLLIVMRRLGDAWEHVRSGRWSDGQALPYGSDLANKTLGIVGMGDIGSAVATRARACGMDIVYHNRTRRIGDEQIPAVWLPLGELLRTSDCVVALTPLTERTRGMFNHDLFAQMKAGAFFVNASRGTVVTTDDLTAALESGHLGGAALDVTDPEPLPASHPLLKLRNVFVSPHIGSATEDTRIKMAELTADNILRGLSAQPLLTPVMPRV